MMPSLATILVLLFYSCHLNTAAKILFLYPLSPGSEISAVQPLAKALLERGHSVTFVTSKIDPFQHPNYTQILPLDTTTIKDYVGNDTRSILEHRLRCKLIFPHFFGFNLPSFFRRCKAVYSNRGFRRKVMNEMESFSVALVSGHLHQCFYGLLSNGNVTFPWILHSPTPFTSEQLPYGVEQDNPAFIPSTDFPFSSDMTFLERLGNSAWRWCITNPVIREKFINGPAEEIYRFYLGSHVKSVREIEPTVSLIFSNSNPILTYARKYPWKVKELACIQCKQETGRTGRKSSVLPSAIEEFLKLDPNGTEPSVVVFTFGTMFKTSSFPNELMNTLLSVFAKLDPVRVIFVSEQEPMKSLRVPRNVKVINRVPLQDLLAHKTLKLIISHGGYQTFMESAWHGVPHLVLPVWSDQDFASASIEKLGIGIRLELLQLTEERLVIATRKLLEDPEFTRRAREVSLILRDKIRHPLDEAVLWVEHVAKHGREMDDIALQARQTVSEESFTIQSICFCLILVLIVGSLQKQVKSKS